MASLEKVNERTLRFVFNEKQTPYCELVDKIDNTLINGVISLDLKNAFDTMDHMILLEKLSLS